MPRNYTTQKKIDIDFGWLKDVKKNKEHYANICQFELEDVGAKALLMLPPGYRLVKWSKEDVDNSFFLALLCDTSGEVTYYIDCAVWEDISLDCKPVTQVLLWRTTLVAHQVVTSGLALHIFRNYLLEHYNVIASDSSHTTQGRDFWERQLGYALAYKEYVYRYNRMTGSLTQITDPEVIVNNSCDLWGDDETYENILAIISKEPLKLPKS